MCLACSDSVCAHTCRPTGPRVTLESGGEALNLVSFNFLGLAGHPEVKAACAAAIHKYGVGSCGPRGFYGTIGAHLPSSSTFSRTRSPRRRSLPSADVHLQLEDAIRRYCGTEDAIIYSYDVVTPASAVPAFAKRGDLLVVDDGCCYALQLGVTLSRSDVRFFKHNDMDDLRRVLEEVQAEDKAARIRTPVNRRFIICEGLYTNHGDVAPLKQLVALKRQFCFRLWVDESVSFGAMPGPAGRGACEAAGLVPEDVDVVTSSLGNTIGSVGGFCIGSKQVINHQRLNAAGYCFSASLPPYLAAGALEALRLLGQRPELRTVLGQNAATLRAGLASVPGILPPAGESFCPVIHVRLADTSMAPAAQEALLQRVCDRTLSKHRVMLVTAKYSNVDRLKPGPSIRIAVSAAHSQADMEAAARALRECLREEGVK